MKDLLIYSYRVAGTVGLMMSKILMVNDRRALKGAIDLGIAMQLTNIARDVVVDAKMGRRYLPGSWVNDMTPEEILQAAENPDGENAAIISSAVRRLLALAEDYYASGRRGLSYLPARAHFAIGVAAKVYRQIGIQLLRSKHMWWGPKQVTSKPSKVFCTIRASFGMFRRFPHPRGSHNENLHLFLTSYMNQGGTWG